MTPPAKEIVFSVPMDRKYERTVDSTTLMVTPNPMMKHRSTLTQIGGDV